MGEIGLTYDYFYSLSLNEYYTIVDGFRRKEVNHLKGIRWATWQIVRHNPFLKRPPAKPENLMKFDDEMQADEATVNKAAEALKKAIQKKNGNS